MIETKGRLAGKVALITGAGAGIGRVAAERFALEGAAVIIAEFDADSGEAVTEAVLGQGGTARGRGDGVAVVPEGHLPRRLWAGRSGGDPRHAGRGLRVTPLARPGLHRTIALAHRSDVAPPRAARELQRMLLER